MMQRRELAIILCCAVLGSVQAVRLRFNNDHGSIVTMLREATAQHVVDNDDPQHNVHDNNEAGSRGKDDSRAQPLRDFTSMRDKFDSFFKKRDPERPCCLNSVLEGYFYTVNGLGIYGSHNLQFEAGHVFFNYSQKRFAADIYIHNEGTGNSTSITFSMLSVFDDSTSTVDEYVFNRLNKTCKKTAHPAQSPDPCIFAGSTFIQEDTLGALGSNHSLPVQQWHFPGTVMQGIVSVEPTLCIPVTFIAFGADKDYVSVGATYFIDYQLTAPPSAFVIPDFCTKSEMSDNVQPQLRMPSFMRQIIGI